MRWYCYFRRPFPTRYCLARCQLANRSSILRFLFAVVKDFIKGLRKLIIRAIVLGMEKSYAKQKVKWAARREAMRKMLDSGASKADVARKFGIKPQRINQLFPRVP